MHLPERITILGTPVDPWTMTQTLQQAREQILSGGFAHVVGVNADKVLQIRDSPEVADLLGQCEIINADGASMVLASRFLGMPVPERVAGIDLMQTLCGMANQQGYSVYLLGATSDVVEQTRVKLEERYSNLRIVGTHDGYFEECDYPAIAQQVRDVAPQIVFVGITSPKKEILIEFFRAEGLEGLFVGVGGSFDVISGNIPRAPEWVQQCHLEWLFRLLQEPRRLMRRYLIGNTRFLWVLLSEKANSLKGNSR